MYETKADSKQRQE